MNVLMITPDFPYSFGGIGEHVYHLIKYMDKSDMIIHLFVARFADSNLGIREVSDELGNKVYIHEVRCHSHDNIEELFRNKKPNGFCYQFEALKTCAHNMEVFTAIQRFIEEERVQFDVLHIHDAFDAIDALLLGEMYSIPTVLTAHSIGNEKFLIDGIRKYVICNADKVIFVSNYLKKACLERYRIDIKNAVVIPNGIENNGIEKWNFKKKGSLVYVGRLEEKKGVDTLIKAISIIVEKYGCNYSLDVYGEGSCRGNLEEMVHLLRLEQFVHFKGYQEKEKIEEAFINADITVVPSKYEAFGLVVIEAMNKGCPLICSDIETFTEIVSQDYNGVLFRNQDSGDLAEKIVCLMDSEEKRKLVAQNALNDVHKRFEWSEIAKQTKDVYLKILCADCGGYDCKWKRGGQL